MCPVKNMRNAPGRPFGDSPDKLESQNFLADVQKLFVDVYIQCCALVVLDGVTVPQRQQIFRAVTTLTLQR